MEKTETAPSKSAFKDPAKSCVGFSDQVFAGRRDGRRYLVQTLKLRLRGSNRGGIGGEEQYPAVHTGETTSTIAEGVERDESTRPSTNQEHTYLRSCRVVPEAEMDVWVTRAYSAPLRGGGQTEFGHGDPSPIRRQLTVRSSSALHMTRNLHHHVLRHSATVDFNPRHTKRLLAVEASALLVGISGEAKGRIPMLAVNRLGESGGLVFSTFHCCVGKHLQENLFVEAIGGARLQPA